MNSPLKWFALISLYLVQGLPHGFFGQAMPVLLREQGVDLKSIGLMSLVALPWALKFIWAPVLDRVSIIPGEYRRSWILAMNHTAVLVLIALSFVPLPWLTSDGVLALALVLMAVNLLTATQDIATDAVAVENLKPAERGLGNGIQVGGYRVGMVLAGGVLLSFFNHLGWQFSLLSVAALMFVGSLPQEQFDVSVCNPPFHASAEEALRGSQRKVANLNKDKAEPNSKPLLNFGGMENELWCNGGEALFLKKMIKESKQFASQVRWFTSLVSKAENVKPLSKLANKAGATDVKVIEMTQGKKQTRILAWTFQAIG